MKNLLVAALVGVMLAGCGNKTFSDQEVFQNVEKAEKEKDPRVGQLDAVAEKRDNISQSLMALGAVGLLDEKFVDELNPLCVALAYHIAKAQVAFVEKSDSFEAQVKEADILADQIIEKMKVKAEKLNEIQKQKAIEKQMI